VTDNGIKRGILRSVADTTGGLRTCQATIEGIDTDDDVEHAEPYGLASAGVAGAHVLVVHVGGDESHPVTIAVSDARYRPAVSGGAVSLYDSSGKVVALSSAGILLGSGATKSVARTGDAIAVSQASFIAWMGQVTTYINTLTPGAITPFVGSPTGTITSGSATVKAVD
jgi:phage gp45-like